MTHNDLFSIRESLDILEAAEILSEPKREYIYQLIMLHNLVNYHI